MKKEELIALNMRLAKAAPDMGPELRAVLEELFSATVTQEDWAKYKTEAGIDSTAPSPYSQEEK